LAAVVVSSHTGLQLSCYLLSGLFEGAESDAGGVLPPLEARGTGWSRRPPFPGLGHLRRDADRYTWVPVTFSPIA
jgi:hypothetical protein